MTQMIKNLFIFFKKKKFILTPKVDENFKKLIFDNLRLTNYVIDLQRANSQKNLQKKNLYKKNDYADKFQKSIYYKVKNRNINLTLYCPGLTEEQMDEKLNQIKNMYGLVEPKNIKIQEQEKKNLYGINWINKIKKFNFIKKIIIVLKENNKWKKKS